MRVSEIFYSLQGEGARAGDPSIFIRLSGCSAKHACVASGIVCDTEFESGQEMTPEALLAQIRGDYPCKWIVWTGGEPLDQLTPEIVRYFRREGDYKQALETSGIQSLAPFAAVTCAFDYIAVSPKVAEHVLIPRFPLRADGTHVNELRYVRHRTQDIPVPSLKAHRYYLSPHTDGVEIPTMNLRHCIDLCLQHPSWSLSVQQHKQWLIL